VSVDAVAVLLCVLVVVLMRTKQLKVVSGVVCILFGLVLGSTSAGPAIDQGLASGGSWLWANVSTL
jgi:hypothetical protein